MMLSELLKTGIYSCLAVNIVVHVCVCLQVEGGVKTSDVYKPIRIKTFFEEISRELSTDDELNLNRTVNLAVGYIQSLMSVIRSTDSLVLPRSGCRSKWFRGVNKGRCSAKVKRYRGEYCLENFKIPNEHLEELVTWSDSALINSSRVWYDRGAGVVDTDFILYVQATTSSQCVSSMIGKSDSSLVAYSSYCKLGWNERPIAGYINFCPAELHQLKTDRKKYLLTTIHEIFHALGFSRDLFEKYKDCVSPSMGNVCSNRAQPLYKNVDNVPRVITPAVERNLRLHLNCSREDFGAPLQILKGAVQSHWDSFLMQGSIMAPVLGLPSEIFIDPITLGLFEDTGWYKINYALADDYPWGKDEGCDFGMLEDPDSCELGNTGCNFLQTHKAECLYSKYQKRNVFKSLLNGSCSNSTTRYFDGSEEIFGDSSFCFYTNLTNYSSDFQETPLEGRCYEANFKGQGILEVRVQGSDWIQCPSGTVVVVPGFLGVLKCPLNVSLLHHKRITPVYLSETFLMSHRKTTDSQLNHTSSSYKSTTVHKTEDILTQTTAKYNTIPSTSHASKCSDGSFNTVWYFILLSFLQYIEVLC